MPTSLAGGSPGATIPSSQLSIESKTTLTTSAGQPSTTAGSSGAGSDSGSGSGSNATVSPSGTPKPSSQPNNAVTGASRSPVTAALAVIMLAVLAL